MKKMRRMKRWEKRLLIILLGVGLLVGGFFGFFWLKSLFIPPLLEAPTLEVTHNGEKLKMFFDYTGLDKPELDYSFPISAGFGVEVGSVLEFSFNAQPKEIHVYTNGMSFSLDAQVWWLGLNRPKQFSITMPSDPGFYCLWMYINWEDSDGNPVRGYCFIEAGVINYAEE